MHAHPNPTPQSTTAGFTGKLTMRIPWSQLRSKAVVIQIDDLYVIAGPSILGEADAEAEQARINKEKAEALRDLNEAMLKVML